MLRLEFSPQTGRGKYGLSDCFKPVGFEINVAVTASAPEERDSTEDNERAPFAAHAFGYGEEVNQAGLEEAWRMVWWW